MKKKTDKELGYIITDGMIDTIGNSDLSDAQVGMFVRSVIGGNRDYAKGDMIVKALVTAFYDQFQMANKRRSDSIGKRRQGNRDRERARREEAKLAHERLEKINEICDNMLPHAHTCDNMSAHVRTCALGKGSKGSNNIPPFKSPQWGDKKLSSAKGEGGAGKGTAKNGGRPSTARPSKLSRTGIGPAPTTGEDEAQPNAGTTKRPKGGRGPSSRPTAQTWRSGDSRERPATSSKKTGAPEIGPIQRIASAMAGKHPNSKSGPRAVVRALAATIEDEGGDAADTLRRIEEAHAAWCQTADWDESQGKYVMALDKWITNGGWRKLPPQKKKTPPPKGDDMSFGASL